jgi:hypothetical protein
MKRIAIVLLCLFAINIHAQDDKTVTLVVSGSGVTQEEAKQNALRSAIEQAFGAFISSKTEILNDNLVKDEIVAVSNGNIRKYDIISEAITPNQLYNVSINAVVSINKLKDFCENKGIAIEIEGGLFAANIAQQQLNELSEEKAVLNLSEVSMKFLMNSIDFELKVAEQPIATSNVDTFLIPLTVNVKPNENLDKFYDYFTKTMSAISMNKAEALDYSKIGKKVFQVWIQGEVNKTEVYLRSQKSLFYLKNLFLKSYKVLDNFRIETNIDTFYLYTLANNENNSRVRGAAGGVWETWYPGLDFSNAEILSVECDEAYRFGTTDEGRENNNDRLISLYNEFTGDFFLNKEVRLIYFNDSNLLTLLPPVNYGGGGHNLGYYVNKSNLLIISTKSKDLKELYKCDRKYGLSEIKKLKSIKIKPISTQEFFQFPKN